MSKANVIKPTIQEIKELEEKHLNSPEFQHLAHLKGIVLYSDFPVIGEIAQTPEDRILQLEKQRADYVRNSLTYQEAMVNRDWQTTELMFNEHRTLVDIIVALEKRIKELEDGKEVV